MSRIAFLTEAFRRAQPAPPSLSSAGWTPSTPEYFWTRSRRSTGSRSRFSSSYAISMNSRSSPSTGTRVRPRKRPMP